MIRLYDLRTNHQTEPLGIGTNPEFSWRIECDEENFLQASYRVIVRNKQETVWDSGVVPGRKQAFVPYQGAPLASSTRYDWEVTVRGESGQEARSIHHFETAILSPKEWDATWIESTIERNPNPPFTYGVENPAVSFLRTISLQGEISQARLYATAYGCYSVRINGQAPDDREFAPEFTPYGKILNFQTYDIGAFLHPGENLLSFLVADGWFFCGQTAVQTPKPHTAHAVLFQLDVRYQDGRKERFHSDGTETFQTDTIVFSDLFMGEKQDRTRKPGIPRKVATFTDDFSILRPQPMPPVRSVERIPAQAILHSPNGETIVDFGQVVSGRARIFVHEPHGREITFEYTEVLDKDQNYFSTMIAQQKDTLVSDGNPLLYEAKFTFHGFRYIRVTGMTEVQKEDFTAVLLSTEKENASEFLCSDPRIDRLHQNIRYSQKNNMMSIPTDCPTREKAGWTGDILIYARTAMLNENVTPFLTSWLEGLMAEQMEHGVLPIVSPYPKYYALGVMNMVKGFGDDRPTGVAGWSDAIVWVPQAMYQMTGNDLILRRCYDSMKKWCDYIVRTAAEKRGSNLPESIDRYLWNTGFHFGEWLVPGREAEGLNACKETAGYIAPFFGYRTIRMMSEIAHILNQKEDSAYYGEMAEKMKWAIQQGLFETDSLPRDLMGGYVLALAFDLVPAKWEEEYQHRLSALIENNGGCLGTGFLATPFLLDVLEKIGRKDLAKTIFLQTKSPSWLSEVEHGATTIWENWISYEKDGTPLKTSFDHYAFGCVDDWICRRFAGIDALESGFSRILISPKTDLGIDWCERSFRSEAGEIYVRWTKEELSVRIPCNTTARVEWKGKTHEVGSGHYHYDVDGNRI